MSSIGERLNNSATDQLKQKNYEKALSLYNRALLFVAPDRHPNLLSNRSYCHFKLLDYKSALMDSRKAIEYDKKHEKAYEGIIKSSIHLGDLVGAEIEVKSLKSINPENEYIKTAIRDCNYIKSLEKEAGTCAILKNFERAIVKISIALTIASNSEHLHSLKSQYLFAKKNQKDVRIFYKTFFKINFK